MAASWSYGAFMLAVAVHQWEEARDLPAWSLTHARWPLRPLSAPAFRWAAACFGLVVWVLGAMAWAAPAGSFWPHVWAGLCLAMAGNALLPHLALSLRQRHYMPGTATGLGLVLPTAAWCWWEDWHSGRINADALIRFTPWVLLATGASVPLLLWLGARLRPPPSSRGAEETIRK